MASRSTEREEELEAYKNGWAALSKLMDSGRSWSGNERNCGLVNVGDGSFCDVSTLSGFDFKDDGRGVAVTDWDRDGHLDLWLRNRTGPQLRFLRNRAGGGHHFLALRLEGVDCNRDAVGARVTAQVGERVLTGTVRAGEGYLSQSSKWLHLGLGKDRRIERLAVDWPGGGRSVLEDLEGDRFYHLVQGQSDAEVVATTRVRLAPAELPTVDPGPARVVLRTPIPIPAEVWLEIFGRDATPGAAWIQLWAQWCAPCLVEMDAFVAGWPALEAAGLRVAALTLDEEADLARARSVFDERVGSKLGDVPFVYAEPSARTRTFLRVLLEHVLARSGDGVLPTGLLVDRFGYVEIVSIGPIEVDQLARDARTFGNAPEKVGLRSLFPGRWFFGMPRNLPGLAGALQAEGLGDLARFYRTPGLQEGFKQR